MTPRRIHNVVMLLRQLREYRVYEGGSSEKLGVASAAGALKKGYSDEQADATG
jgi:hypothetical protein